MIGFILLRGKDFTIPDSVSTAIIGLFFGLVCGLFYYQRYYRAYFWVFSLLGGLLFTYLSHTLFMRGMSVDDASSLRLTLASFVIPFVLTLGLNHALSKLKSRKRKQHTRQKLHSRFFDTVNAGEILRPDARLSGR